MVKKFDFKEKLISVCQEIRPKRVLEWGPGQSTKIIHAECPEAEIISIEHDKKWFGEAQKNHGKYAKIYFVPIENKLSKYPSWPILNNLGAFDLIFVDGRRRMSCLIVAHQIINPKGKIILHDANRQEYQPAYDTLYKLGFKIEGDTTLVFSYE